MLLGLFRLDLCSFLFFFFFSFLNFGLSRGYSYYYLDNWVCFDKRFFCYSWGNQAK